MKILRLNVLLIFTAALVFAGCDLDANDDFVPDAESYELHSVDGSNISGVVVFESMEDGATLITIQLDGTESGAEHPAHIHANSAVEGGGIDVTLNPVDGNSGMSQTEVNSLDNGTSVTFEDLVGHDGHIMVHLSEDEIATVLSRGDIGGNAFTGSSATYDLHEANDSGISGIVRFWERNNENTLAVIELTGTTEEGNHPAHIHDNTVAEGGGIAVPFNNVDGETGISRTNIRADETAGDNLTFSALLDFNGHVNVHRSDEDLAVIAEGNIGANEDADVGNGDGNGNENGPGY